ncbi:hypothetical protein BDV39DRAFT_210847 [Aspergillus sergii]|uniref:Uncharacterized protein n=1 Tax=Aspergillus sergii TaxID=1034303 RepID=A0A5N6WKC6_9EURO|nr:hypothetical protein BDV39DRAFT_210847 [Aspergillus sergii]
MRLYIGKLNADPYAENEIISFSFNAGFRQGSTAYLVGQWTQGATGEPKANYRFQGTITKLEDGQIEIFKDEDVYYWFKGRVSGESNKELVLEMYRKHDAKLYGNATLSFGFKED